MIFHLLGHKNPTSYEWRKRIAVGIEHVHVTGRNPILGYPRGWGFEMSNERSEGIFHAGIIGEQPNPAAAKMGLSDTKREKEGKQVINGVRT